MKCPNCGADNPENATFCMSCASQLESGTGYPPPSTRAEVLPAVPSDKRRNLVVAAAVVVVVAIVAIAALAWTSGTFNAAVDSDGDGINDSDDFYDSGNGKVRISVDFYRGDGSADFWTSGDPFFLIRFDPDCDAVFEDEYESQVYVDTETISSPYSIVIDIPDNTKRIQFQIQVWESDLEGDYPVDYCPSASGTCYEHTVNAPFSQSWSYDGSDDGLSETDCELEYSISVTG